MNYRTPARLIDCIARLLSISKEEAASLSLVTVADLMRVGVLPRAPELIETTGEPVQEAWVR